VASLTSIDNNICFNKDTPAIDYKSGGLFVIYQPIPLVCIQNKLQVDFGGLDKHKIKN
jgi:hypothetical protein